MLGFYDREKQSVGRGSSLEVRLARLEWPVGMPRTPQPPLKTLKMGGGEEAEAGGGGASPVKVKKLNDFGVMQGARLS